MLHNFISSFACLIKKKYILQIIVNFECCTGIPKIEVQKTVAAGDVIEGKMSGGAAHGGGHCSMIVSVDEKTWYKIGDYKDCTTKGSLQFTMPKGVPRECSGDAGCTFGWLWTPIFSGTCEIYMNCYHLKARVVCAAVHHSQSSQTRTPMLTLHPIVAGHGCHGWH